MDNKDSAVKVSSGVESLIQRLRDEGVNEGRSKAETIVAEAESRAEWIIKQAEEEAERIVNKARTETERLEKGGREALQAAARDAMLTLKGRLTERFTRQVRRLVSDEMKKEELLQRLIIEVAGKTRAEIDAAKQVEVLLPKDVAGLEQLAQNPEELEKGILTHFIRLINRDILKENVELLIAGDDRNGIRLRLVDQGVTVDLSDQAVADLLLEHLAPRFRALLEGIVK